MTETGWSGLKTFSAYLQALFQYTGVQAYLAISLLIVVGLTEGVSLLILIPFLQLLGMPGAAASSLPALWINNILRYAGIPLTLPAVLGTYIVVVTLCALVKRWQEVLHASIVHGFTQTLRDRLYDDLSHSAWSRLAQSRTSDVIHTLTIDLQRIGAGTQQLMRCIGTMVLTLAHLIVALTLSALITVITLFCATALLLALRSYHRQAQSSGEALREAMNDLYAAATDFLGNLKVAKSYGLEDWQTQKFRSFTQSVAGQFIRFARISAASNMYYEIGAVIVLTIFFYGAVELIKVPIANLLLLVFLFARILPKFSLMQQCLQQIVNMLPSYQTELAMQQRFAAAREVRTPGGLEPVALARAISLRDISFRYDQNQEVYALRHINLALPAGQITAVIGPSGSGKSTLADLLMGLLTPSAGEIILDGRPLTGNRLGAWRRAVGYVPQESVLFHDTIRANLVLDRTDFEDAELRRVLRLAAAEDFVAGLPHGLDTVVADRGSRLSGGERQRIALARALLRRPLLLLLDEATSSLDAENEGRILEAVARLHGQVTIVVIAHRLSTIRGADHVVMLEQGRVVENGAWDQLAARPDSRLHILLANREKSKGR